MAKIIQLKDKDGDVYPITQETVLYNSSSGTTGNVTLSDNVSNYEYIEIFYYKNDYYSSTKIYTPNGKKAALQATWNNGSVIQLASETLSISGTSIAREHYANINIENAGVITASWYTTNDSLFITRVVGYK